MFGRDEITKPAFVAVFEPRIEAAALVPVRFQPEPPPPEGQVWKLGALDAPLLIRQRPVVLVAAIPMVPVELATIAPGVPVEVTVFKPEVLILTFWSVPSPAIRNVPLLAPV